MKRIGQILLVSFTFAMFGLTQDVFAHELEQSNGISAVLHIPPDDNPLAGKKTVLNVAYGDKAQKFSLENCSCFISVVQNEHVLSTVKATPALPHSKLDSAVKVIFPNPGKYEVRVSGISIDNSFAEFEIEFPVKITNSAIVASNKAGYQVLIFAIGTLLINAMIAYTLISKGKRYK